MHLVCPVCGNKIKGSDVNLSAALAKCKKCNAVFAVHGAHVHGSQPLQPLMPRMPAVPPLKIKVKATGRDLKFSWSWHDPSYYWFIPFVLIWNAPLAMMSFAFLFYPENMHIEGSPVALAIFAPLYFIVAIWATYGLIASFVNSTEIEVSEGTLYVRYVPLFWTGGVELPTDTIDQLFCTRYMKSKDQDFDRFDLVAHLRDGTQRVLIQMAPDANFVWFLEQQLETHLKIEDRRMEDEHLG